MKIKHWMLFFLAFWLIGQAGVPAQEEGNGPVREAVKPAIETAKEIATDSPGSGSEKPANEGLPLPSDISEKSEAAPAEMGEREPPSVDVILDRIEKRYQKSPFSAHFDQESTIEALEITDTADGTIMVEPPGKMRWVYDSPEPQVIVTDGETLWVHRPLDNQVMVGDAAIYFGEGKGGGFLSDIRVIRERFDIDLQDSTDPDFYRLNLIPREKKFDISSILLLVSQKEADITEIITYNAYGDETRIIFSRIEFHQDLNDTLFRLDIPAGADLLQLDE